jgi:hypothetical protein
MKFGYTALIVVTALVPGVVRAADTDSVLVEWSVHGEMMTIRSEVGSDLTWEAPLNEAVHENNLWQLTDRFAITEDTLYLNGTSYPTERMGHLEVIRDGSSVKVRVYDRGDKVRRGRRRSNLTGSADSVLVEEDAFVRGYVLNFGGDVRVAGEVNRSVVTIGSDVSVEDGGVIRGSVVSLGGDVHKSGDAQVYGDVFANNSHKFRPRWYEDPEQNVLQFNIALEYNRVTGGLPWARFKAGPEAGYAPRLAVDAGYAFESEMWHYRLGAGRDGWFGPQYYAGAYRLTKDDDAVRIGPTENTFFALLFGTDYRDYYFAEGFKAEFGWGFGENRRLMLGYHNELVSPLEANRSQWSLFNGGSFQRNYEQLWLTGDTTFVSDFSGRLNYLTAEAYYKYPEFSDRDEGSWMGGAVAEVSSDGLGSDFDYSRYYAFVARSQPLWHEQTLLIRILAGSSANTLPATRLFYLGGISSLRGFDHKEFFGDRIWQFNTEYAWSFGLWELFALYDAGQVGYGNDFTDSEVRHNLGAGFQIQRTFRVQVATDARFVRNPLVTVRFTQPF